MQKFIDKISKIPLEAKNLPTWLPKEILDSEFNQEESFSKRNKELRNSIIPYKKDNIEDSVRRGKRFIYGLFHEEILKNFWKKLVKINPDKTFRLIWNIENLFTFYRGIDISNFDSEKINKFAKKAYINNNNFGFIDVLFRSELNKLENATLALRECQNLIKTLKGTYSSYTTEFDFEDWNKDEYIGETEHYQFMDDLEKYTSRLSQLVANGEKERKRNEFMAKIENPISRKNSTENSEAILWAKKLKVLFLRIYDKPFNKEIGNLISVIFGDNEKIIYDADYIAKITKEVHNSFRKRKKMEDSN